MINPASLNSIYPKSGVNPAETAKTAGSNDKKPGFANTIKAVEKYLSKVDDSQQSSDIAIKELLANKNGDINTMVASVAKADMSFKLLVGVRNKLIEAYKQTMNMPL